MITRDSILARWLWGMLVLSVVLLLGIQVTATVAKLQYRPTTLSILAPVPTGEAKERAINVHGSVAVHQTFQAPGGIISHIGVGVSDFRQAPPEAAVIVELREQGSDTMLATAAAPVAAVRSDDVTLWPLTTELTEGETYVVTVRAPPVSTDKSLSIHYEPSSEAYTLGKLSIGETISSSKQRPGNIHVALYRYPTKQVLAYVLLRSPLSYVIGLYGLTIVLLGIWRPVRLRAVKLLLAVKALPHERIIPAKEMAVVWFIATVIALGITAPFYLHLENSDTQGDVQRMLLYRAIGRDGLMHEGSIARWDPYSCGGVPLIGNIESTHLSPFFLLTVAFGENIGLRLSVTLTIIFGLTGAYALARRFAKLPPLASWLAAILFVLSGFQMLALATGVLSWMPVGLVPWFIYFLLRAQGKSIHILTAGLLLTVVFLEGNPHMPMFAALVAFVLMAVVSLQQRSPRPLVVLMLACIITANVGAVKLLPAAELMGILGDTFERPPAFTAPLSWVPKMFWYRDQVISERWFDPATGIPYRWPEYGTYVGILPVVIFLAGLPLLLRKKYLYPWLALAVVFFLMTFGLFPWNVLREIPVVSEIVRNANRLRSMFLLAFGVVTGASLVALMTHVKPKALRYGTSVFVVGLIMGDLLVVHAPLFTTLFDHPQPQLEHTASFQRRLYGYTDEPNGYYRAAYVNYLANEAVTDLCVPNMSINRDIAATGYDSSDPDKPYRGEVYLLGSDMPAKLTYVSATQLRAEFVAEKDNWLVFNHNYFPGWKSHLPREIAAKNGLLAVRVEASDTTMSLTYLTPAYRLGKYISLISLLTIALLFGYNRQNMTEKT